jgi:hypothetical protein
LGTSGLGRSQWTEVSGQRNFGVEVETELMPELSNGSFVACTSESKKLGKAWINHGKPPSGGGCRLTVDGYW